MKVVRFPERRFAALGELFEEGKEVGPLIPEAGGLSIGAIESSRSHSPIQRDLGQFCNRIT